MLFIPAVQYPDILQSFSDSDSRGLKANNLEGQGCIPAIFAHAPVYSLEKKNKLEQLSEKRTNKENLL